jgi:EAL domain-containing protein (putative c-di-GMP-specific phosphodiesterase class I)
MGVRLSLDDFGTGYSSLSYLKDLPFHTLKIDRSFVSKIPGQPGDSQIITTILALARGFELEVIAEGIETQTQYDFLRDHGCEYGQGYLMSRPQPAAALADMLGRPLLAVNT